MREEVAMLLSIRRTGAAGPLWSRRLTRLERLLLTAGVCAAAVVGFLAGAGWLT
jgi:hypothetical protein